MATYVMADIHGEYDKFIKMLQHIDFNSDDTLYIVGDVIDRGPDSVKLLKDLSLRDNVYTIVGNHELVARLVLRKLLVEVTDDNADSHLDAETIGMYLEWSANGGSSTIKEFQKLPLEERFDLLDFLDEFTLYEIIDIGPKTFILVHGGLGNYAPGKKLSQYTPDELTFCRPDYNINYFKDPDVFVVSGHTPTLAITGDPNIYYNGNNIVIDCGAAYGGRLACLRLDDMKEFYV